MEKKIILKPFQVRLPAGLYLALVADAKRKGYKLQTWLAAVIAAKLKVDPATGEPRRKD